MGARRARRGHRAHAGADPGAPGVRAPRCFDYAPTRSTVARRPGALPRRQRPRDAFRIRSRRVRWSRRVSARDHRRRFRRSPLPSRPLLRARVWSRGRGAAPRRTTTPGTRPARRAERLCRTSRPRAPVRAVPRRLPRTVVRSRASPRALTDCSRRRAPHAAAGPAFSASLLISLAVDGAVGGGHVRDASAWTLTPLRRPSTASVYPTRITRADGAVPAETPRRRRSPGCSRARRAQTDVIRMQIHILGYVPYIRLGVPQPVRDVRARAAGHRRRFCRRRRSGAASSRSRSPGRAALPRPADGVAGGDGARCGRLARDLVHRAVVTAAKANAGRRRARCRQGSDRFDDLLYLKRTEAC